MVRNFLQLMGANVSSSPKEPRDYLERVPIGDAGMAVIYKGLEHGERLQITSITLDLPEGVGTAPGEAPTFRKISALLSGLPDSTRALGLEAQRQMQEIERRSRLSSANPDAERLTPPRGRLTDEFLTRVAQSYSEHAKRTHKPNKNIADEIGVPVGTVRRWVVEARRRGLLPPGERGRAT